MRFSSSYGPCRLQFRKCTEDLTSYAYYGNCIFNISSALAGYSTQMDFEQAGNICRNKYWRNVWWTLPCYSRRFNSALYFATTHGLCEAVLRRKVQIWLALEPRSSISRLGICNGSMVASIWYDLF
jgi:hypothetical protein